MLFPIIFMPVVYDNFFFFLEQIAELGEIENLASLPLLRVLNLLRNPVQVRDHLYQGREHEDFLGIILQEVVLIRNVKNVNTM